MTKGIPHIIFYILKTEQKSYSEAKRKQKKSGTE